MTGVIYFVQRKNGDVKIGTTKRLTSRLAELRSEYGRLKLLGVIKGGRVKEKILHWCLSDSWIENEWFEPTQDIQNIIAEYATIPDGINTNGIIPKRKRLYNDSWQVLQVAKMYRVDSETMNEWIKDGKFPGVFEEKLSPPFTRTMIPYQDLDEWIKENLIHRPNS